MIKLLKNARLFAPRECGVVDILIAGDKVAQIDSNIEMSSRSCEIVDLEGAIVVPGFVDTLVHITGGGGEGGFATRTPEIQGDEIALAGVTSLVGALGTDSVSRTLHDLYGKTRQLTGLGFNCFMQTGSYHYPVKTLTGSIESDIVLVDRVIGVGEIAIADHRGSFLTVEELARVANEVRVAGMLCGKQGVVSVHVGDDEEGLSLLNQAAEKYHLKRELFYPTHISRTSELLSQGTDYAKAGGFIDFTTSTNDSLLATGELRASEALALAVDKGAPINRLTMSSDAQGSLPLFDENQCFVGLDIGRISSLHDEACRLVNDYQMSLSDAVSTISFNPAKAVGLNYRGAVAAGYFADLVILNDDLSINSTMANGQWLAREGKVCLQSVFGE